MAHAWTRTWAEWVRVCQRMPPQGTCHKDFLFPLFLHFSVLEAGEPSFLVTTRSKLSQSGRYRLGYRLCRDAPSVLVNKWAKWLTGHSCRTSVILNCRGVELTLGFAVRVCEGSQTSHWHVVLRTQRQVLLPSWAQQKRSQCIGSQK